MFILYLMVLISHHWAALQSKFSIPSISGLIYLNISNQAKHSHESGYQLLLQYVASHKHGHVC